MLKSPRIELTCTLLMAVALAGCESDTVIITPLSTPPIDAVVTNEKVTMTAGTAIEVYVEYCDNFELDDEDLEGWDTTGPIVFAPIDGTKTNDLDGNFVLAGLSAGTGDFHAVTTKGGAVVVVEVVPQEGL